MSQPTKKSVQKDFWRREYIRLLTQDVSSEPDRVADKDELERIEDLIEAGYLKGSPTRDSEGQLRGVRIIKPTLLGRIFAEQQQDILDGQSLYGRIKSGAGLFIGWVSGIISAVVIWYLTK